jgi:hypothetical protein
MAAPSLKRNIFPEIMLPDCPSLAGRYSRSQVPFQLLVKKGVLRILQVSGIKALVTRASPALKYSLIVLLKSKKFQPGKSATHKIKTIKANLHEAMSSTFLSSKIKAFN